MTAAEKLNQAAKIAQEAEDNFPDYTTWFNTLLAEGSVTMAQFSLYYPQYRDAKMTAAKRAVADWDWNN